MVNIISSTKGHRNWNEEISYSQVLKEVMSCLKFQAGCRQREWQDLGYMALLGFTGRVPLGSHTKAGWLSQTKKRTVWVPSSRVFSKRHTGDGSGRWRRHAHKGHWGSHIRSLPLLWLCRLSSEACPRLSHWCQLKTLAGHLAKLSKCQGSNTMK